MKKRNERRFFMGNYEDYKEIQELLNKKLEKKKQDEEKLKNLPPEKRKKMEEKEQKDSLKKKYPRKIMKF